MRARSRVRTRAALLGTVALAASLLPAQAVKAGAPDTLTIRADRAVHLADEGARVRIGVTVTTADGAPTASASRLTWTAGATSGDVVVPAGTAAGAVQPFIVPVPSDDVAGLARTVPVTVRAGGSTAETTIVVNAHGLPYLDARLPVERRVADLLSRMTIEEKVGQLTQAERAAVDGDRSMITNLALGSVLSGSGSAPTPNTPAAWVATVDDFQTRALATRLQIPLVYGVDAVHGHGNVYGATIFPHNVGLGATRDPALLERIGHATAVEVRATGVPWNFSPCLCVSRDERWGRAYEALSEDPALVIRLASLVDGLQGRRPGQLADDDRVLATAKHYAGDGDTVYGSAAGDYRIDQGVTVTSRADFARIDLSPYVPAVRRHDVGTVMPSFSSVDFTDDGVGNPVKLHAHRELITDVLKRRIGFDGFVISDWQGIHQIPDPDQPGFDGLTAHKVRTGVNAGIDMFMEPNSAPQFVDLLLAEVAAGRVGRARVDEAVRRILRAKFRLGLFERPFAPAGRTDLVGAPAHRAIARQAAAASQVLLRNTAHDGDTARDGGAALPLRPDEKIYVAGRNADDIGNQAGGWTITWQGFSGEAIPGTTIVEGIREVAPRARVTVSPDASAPFGDARVGVVVVGETPYSEGFGDVGGPLWAFDPADGGVPREPKTLGLKPADQAVIDKVCAAVETCVVLLVSGRPQVIDAARLANVDALVASWLPGSEGAGVADVLFGRRPFTGRLPVTWPRTEAQVPINVGDADYDPLYPYGWGLRTDPARTRLATAAVSGAARRHVLLALAPANWRRDGSPRRVGEVLTHLSAAVRAGVPATAAETLVSVARDAAQDRAVSGRAPAGWAAAIADADAALASGDAARALTLLRRVAG